MEPFIYRTKKKKSVLIHKRTLIFTHRGGSHFVIYEMSALLCKYISVFFGSVFVFAHSAGKDILVKWLQP